MKKIDRELKAVKFKAFGKVKFKKKENKKLEMLLKEKDILVKERKQEDDDSDNKIKELDEKICTEIQTKQLEEREKKLENLKTTKEKKGSAAAVFKLKESIIGKKKSSNEANVVLDPVTKIPVMKRLDITRVCVDYCQKLLKNREPKEEFRKDLETKKRVHNLRMKKNYDNDPEFSREMFQEMIQRVKTKGGNKYDFVLKAGYSLFNALFKFSR